jgi:external thioesterase TEII
MRIQNHPASNAKQRQVFLFHFAGGSSYSFRFLDEHLKDLDVVKLELPGRGTRSAEALIMDFERAAEDLLNQVISNLRSGNFVLFGHSMGSSLH